MIIDPTDLDPTATYKLLIGSVVPRPIAWVSTRSTGGIGNIAPVSFFTVVGRKPPILSISLQPRSDGVTLKDTFVNIRDTGEFVTNLSAFELDSDVDEFAAVGLEKERSEVVRPAACQGSADRDGVQCRADHSGRRPEHHVVWGRVVLFHIRNPIYLERGRIDLPPAGNGRCGQGL